MKDLKAIQLCNRFSYQHTHFITLQQSVKETKEMLLQLFSDIKNETLTCLRSQWHEKREKNPQFMQSFGIIPTLKKIFLETKEIQDNHVKDIENINYLKKIEKINYLKKIKKFFSNSSTDYENIFMKHKRKVALESRFKNRQEIFDKKRLILAPASNSMDEEIS